MPQIRGDSFYTPAIAGLAVNLAEGLFDRLVGFKLPERKCLAVTTGLRIRSGSGWIYLPVIGKFWGDEEEAKPFMHYAEGAADLTAREGMSSGGIIDCHPELLRTGDVADRGSFILGDIVTGASAVQSRYNELISAAVCYAGRALIGVSTDVARGLQFDQDAPAFFPENTVPV